MKFTANKNSALFYAAFIAVLIVALALRLPELAQRPMHTDEAVHAIKFGQLFEENSYQYNPLEYHGPTLVYFTLIPASLSGQKTLADVTESTLRVVPLFFGVALILVLLLATNLLPRAVILLSALYLAISPAFVFYSRYYIMEMLLVFFTFMALVTGYKFFQEKKLLWAIMAGISLGLMHATKETCLIAWFAMAAAIVATHFFTGTSLTKSLRAIHKGYFFLGILAGIFVSALFFSSFGANFHGIVDSILTYKSYFTRGTTGAPEHVYRWWQYFKWLLWSHLPGRPLWSEAFMVLLALPGFVAVFSKKNLKTFSGFLPFLAFYTLALTFVYMLIPYKTPWILLGFYHGTIIFAAAGTVVIFSWLRSRLAKIMVIIFLVAGLSHLVWQSVQLNFKYDADYANPYVYAHTDKDFLNLVDAVNAIIDKWPEGKSTKIEVVCPGDDYWPLPWYLRAYTQVGYFSAFDMTKAAGALIITQPALEADLLTKLYETPPPGQRDMYIPHFTNGVWLRPGVEMDLFVRKDVWDEWYRQTPETTP